MTHDHFVQTQSCYAALYDEASPVNEVGFLQSELSAGIQDSRRVGEDECLGLFRFNERLLRRVADGQLLAWTLFLDGVFRAGVFLESSSGTLLHGALANLGSSSIATTLVCPSGRLIIACMSKIGEPQPIALEVEPGVYRLLLERDEDAEFSHASLASVADYPSGEGPDWLFRLQRIGSGDA